MAEARRILIVGGGIGGLSAAIALRKAGFTPQVFEQASELREVGSGVGIWSNCLAHGHRKIDDEYDNYPAECQFILDQLSHVYAVDARCKEEGLSANERCKVHQEQSTQAMDEMYAYTRL